MEQTFERFWDYGQHVANWTNSLLTRPTAHILALRGTADACPSIASGFANGFDHRPRLYPWWSDPQACGQFVGQHMAGEPLAA